MMMAGEVDENRAQEMTTKIYRPLKQLAEKHQITIIVVNHMRKGRENDTASRGGQKMLGSVANHAWSECSLYFTHGKLGTMLVEVESKFAQSMRFEINGLRKRTPEGALTWRPEVNLLDDSDDVGSRGSRASSRSSRRSSPARTPNPRIGAGSRKVLARHLGLDEAAPQAEVRTAWEAAGHTWGEWEGIINSRGPNTGLEGDGATRGRKPDPHPIALQALEKLTERKRKAYTTHEVKDELAKMIGQKPTQTVYLRAYQQLKKLWEQDVITRGGGNNKDWQLKNLTQGDLDDAEIEELI
jgi:hypothetical protein